MGNAVAGASSSSPRTISNRLTGEIANVSTASTCQWEHYQDTGSSSGSQVGTGVGTGFGGTPGPNNVLRSSDRNSDGRESVSDVNDEIGDRTRGRTGSRGDRTRSDLNHWDRTNARGDRLRNMDSVASKLERDMLTRLDRSTNYDNSVIIVGQNSNKRSPHQIGVSSPSTERSRSLSPSMRLAMDTAWRCNF